MSPKKILLQICYEKDRGGETKITEELISMLSLKKQLDIKAVAFDTLTKTDFLHYHFWVLKSLIKWLFFFIKNSGSIIYTTTYTAGCAGALINFFYPLRLIWHYHGSRIPEKIREASIKQRLSQYIKYQLTFNLHKFFLDRVDSIIVPAQFSKNCLIKIFPNIVNKLRIVPNGVNFLDFKKTTSKDQIKIKNKFKIGFGQSVVGLIGRLDPIKNIELFIDTAKEIKSREIVFVFSFPTVKSSEESDYLKILKSKVNKLCLGNNFLFLEGIKKTSDFYCLTDIVVSLSSKENFPLVLLEAWACKKIFTCIAAGELELMLKRIDKGLVINSFDPKKIAEHINSLLNLSKKSKHKIIRKQSKLVKHYGMNKFVDSIYEIINSLQFQ